MSIPKTSAWNWNIYLWSNLIAEWNCWQWRPWANTLAYYPLNNTTTIYDMKWWTWTKYNLTAYWNWISYNNLWVTLSNSYFSWSTIIPSWWPFTISLRCKVGSNEWCLQQFNSNTDNTAITLGSSFYNNNNSYWFSWSKWQNDWFVTWHNVDTIWHNIIYVYQSWKIKYSIDWNEYEQARTITTTSPNYFRIWRWWELNSSIIMNWWSISEVIIENKAWTSEEKLNYFNCAKSNYWY